MTDQPVQVTPSGPPETILEPEPAEVHSALARAQELGQTERALALAEVVAGHPRSLLGWATLGETADDIVEAYAYFRVGYHRGLDQLRQAGWRGSGFVRWKHPPNRGFLRALSGLAASADAIGEVDEADRCGLFLHQLDPGWPPTHVE